MDVRVVHRRRGGKLSSFLYAFYRRRARDNDDARGDAPRRRKLDDQPPPVDADPVSTAREARRDGTARRVNGEMCATVRHDVASGRCRPGRPSFTVCHSHWRHNDDPHLATVAH